MKITRFAFLLFTLSLIAGSSAPAADGAGKAARKQKGAAPLPNPPNAVIQRDIPFSTNGGVTLTLDLYAPKTNSSTPRPVAVYIHGGGWRTGTKSTGGWVNDVTTDLVSRGYAVAAVDYRLAPEAKWPAFIHDVKAAVRFLRAHAAQYQLDPNRIGTWGSSAGGHLVALLGTTDPSAGLEGEGGWAAESSRVQAVVDLFGPSDLTKMGRSDGGERASEVFGREPDTAMKASPVTYISKDDPPFLIIHGDADKLVPVEQSRILYDQLKAAGVPATLVIVKGGAHGLTNAGIEPTKPALVKMIGDFFDQHLRAGANR